VLDAIADTPVDRKVAKAAQGPTPAANVNNIEASDAPVSEPDVPLLRSDGPE